MQYSRWVLTTGLCLRQELFALHLLDLLGQLISLSLLLYI